MDIKLGGKAKRKRIDFEFEAPDAVSVFLAGSFNDWSLSKHPMKKSPEGIWKKSLVLVPGDYEYKIWVDGQWRNDPLNERYCANCFGGVNNIVCVR